MTSTKEICEFNAMLKQHGFPGLPAGVFVNKTVDPLKDPNKVCEHLRTNKYEIIDNKEDVHKVASRETEIQERDTGLVE